MSNLSLPTSPSKIIHSIDINIPHELHQQPVLATLIGSYGTIVNFKAAVLDRKATGGGWFNLSLEGYPEEIEHALNYLRSLGVEIFSHGAVPVVDRAEVPADRLN